MKWSEFIVARGYAQLVHAAESRTLNKEEQRLLEITSASVQAYEARETRQLKTEGAAQ